MLTNILTTGHAVRRQRPAVGRSELKGLLGDAGAPSPGQAAQLGSRNALSPMRAAPKLRSNLGHAQVCCISTQIHRNATPAYLLIDHAACRFRLQRECGGGRCHDCRTRKMWCLSAVQKWSEHQRVSFW